MMMTPPNGEQEPQQPPAPATNPFAPSQETSGAPSQTPPPTQTPLGAPTGEYTPYGPSHPYGPTGEYSPYGPTGEYNPYGYQMQPPVPPYGDMGGMGGMGAPTPPRRTPRAALMALALLVALLIGVGGGVGLANVIASGSASSGKVVIGATSAPAVTISSTTTSLQQNLQSVASAVEPSIVKITSVSGQSEASGSGDILTTNGYIVTNDHVVDGYTGFTVTLPTGATYNAQLVGQDAQDDLAVLKINATNLKPVAIADSSKAQVGDFAIAVGYPLGLSETATFGIVSALNTTASESPSGPAGELAGLVQTSAQLNPGNSGGALVNLQGQLIGIPTLEATDTETNSSANGIGYAISSNRMEYVVKQLIAHGSLTSSGQGFLGIQTQGSSLGVQVAGFTNDAAGQSPAQQAGMQSGDVITAINGKTVSSSDDVAGVVLTAAPGTKVTVTVLRDSNQVTLTVTLGERPTNS